MLGVIWCTCGLVWVLPIRASQVYSPPSFRSLGMSDVFSPTKAHTFRGKNITGMIFIRPQLLRRTKYFFHKYVPQDSAKLLYYYFPICTFIASTWETKTVSDSFFPHGEFFPTFVGENKITYFLLQRFELEKQTIGSRCYGQPWLGSICTHSDHRPKL